MELLLTLVGLWLLWKLFKLSLPSAVLDRHHCRRRFLCQNVDSASYFADRRHYRLGRFTRLTQF